MEAHTTHRNDQTIDSAIRWAVSFRSVMLGPKRVWFWIILRIASKMYVKLALTDFKLCVFLVTSVLTPFKVGSRAVPRIFSRMVEMA